MKKILLYFLLLGSVQVSIAQINYTFSSSTPGFTSNATSTVIIAAGTDDGISSATNIGFNFQFGCTTYTQFIASSNGWLTFNTANSSSSASNNLDPANDFNSPGDRPIIAPLWDDLKAAGNVNYLLSGSSPNRVLTVEWKQMLWNYNATTWAISFQVKLHETSNVIDFVYTRNGSTATTNINSASASIGIGTSTTGDFYSLNGVGGTPTANYGTETSTISSKPATGQMYSFTPVSCSGTPTAGTATATATSGCSGYTSALSLSGTSSGCGLTYQWQSSTNNSTWSNIAGATSSTYTVNETSSLYYHCVVTCSSSGSSSTSSSVYLPVTPNCTAMGNGTVTIPSCPYTGTFYDSGGSTGNYSDGETYTLTFNAPANSCLTFTFTSFGTESCCDYLTIYDGSSTSATPIGTYSGTTSPGTVTASGTSITFYFHSDGSANDIGWAANVGCATTCSGAPATGTVSSSVSTGCASYTSVLSLSGQATGCGISYQWQSSPDNASWTNISGATSTSYTATVSASTYYQCQVSCWGTAATTASNYVTVTPNCYIISTSTINIASCPMTGTFYDTGGSSANYGSSETYTMTFNAPAGYCLSFDFVSFQTESGYDKLSIYDGASSASTLIGTYSGSSTVPGSVTASGTSITFVWTSDGSTTYPGWAANISCTPACSGTPTGGTTSATQSSIYCGSGSTTLSLSGNTSGCGITYQWQSSPNNSAWTNIAGATSSSLTTTLSASTYYQCVVTCNGSSSATSSSQLVSVSAGAPSNDNCSGATSVTVGNCVYGNVTSCSTQSQAGCLGTANDDVWYSFVAPATSVNVTLSASSSFDPVVQVFSGSCGSLTSIWCEDATYTSGGQNQCKQATGLTVGNTYYVRVYDYYSGVPTTTTFTMCLTSTQNYVCNLNYTYSTITNSQDAGVTTSVSGLSDDHLSSAVSIGFDFCFDGFQYSQAYISSNAALVFDAIDPCVPNVSQSRVAASNGVYTGWSIAKPIPTTTDYTPQNAILGPWHDIDPGNGGNITYATLGTAPNRRFVVSYNAVKQFYTSSPCQNSNYDYTGQIKIFETSNNIEIHVQQMNSCTGWNHGQAILGLHNAYGTLAVVPTGYNANASSPYNVYSITNTAWRFTTGCSTCTIILPVDLLEFTAVYNDKVSNKIKWVTKTEENIRYFHLERSVNGRDFSEIKKMVPVSQTGSVYEYNDLLPDVNTDYYYRLTTEDENGKTSSSGIRIVQRAKAGSDLSASVFPNPFTSDLYIQIESIRSGSANIEIFDVTGKRIYLDKKEMKDGTNYFTIENEITSVGLLFVKITSDDGSLIYANKVLKQ